MARAELGNLTVWYCPPSRVNVNCEIRAGSLFRTCPARIGPSGAAFRIGGQVFQIRPQRRPRVHRMYTEEFRFRLAQSLLPGAKSKGVFHRGKRSK